MKTNQNLSWSQYDKKVEKLYEQQKQNKASLIKAIEEKIGRVVGTWRDSDGWFDGFQVDFFAVKTLDGKLIELKGYDNNSAVYQNGGLVLGIEVEE